MLCCSPETVTQFSENYLAKIILSTTEPHEALLVSKAACFEEAKAAFKHIALKLHPDKSTSSQAVEAFKKARDALYQIERYQLKQARWSAESNEQTASQVDPGLDKDRLQSAKAAWAKPKDAFRVKKKKKKSKASRGRTTGRASQPSTSEGDACSPVNKASVEELHYSTGLSHHSPSLGVREGAMKCASETLRHRWALPHNERESIEHTMELTSSSEDEGLGSQQGFGIPAGRAYGRASAEMPAEELTAQQRWQKPGAARPTGLPSAMKGSSQSESASESDGGENPVSEPETAYFARFACQDPPKKGISELKRVGKRLWKGSIS